jgi:hypothetical protein
MKLSYGPEVDALRIVFRETTVTTKHLAESIAADYDAAGRLAGTGSAGRRAPVRRQRHDAAGGARRLRREHLRASRKTRPGLRRLRSGGAEAKRVSVKAQRGGQGFKGRRQPTFCQQVIAWPLLSRGGRFRQLWPNWGTGNAP